MVTEPEDVLSALAPMLREGPSPPFLAPTERSAEARLPDHPREAPPQVPDADRERLLTALGPAPIDIDELGRATGLSARAIQVALLELTLAGRVERHGHQLVSLKG
jgi:DNA processing protein